MSHRSCFYFTSRQSAPQIQMSLSKVNHAACVKVFILCEHKNREQRTHHKQTYFQRITFCSPIILLENPPFILMEIWIKHFQTEIRELLRLFGEKNLLWLAPYCEVYWSLCFSFWNNGTLTVILWLWSVLEKWNEKGLFVFYCLLAWKQKQD